MLGTGMMCSSQRRRSSDTLQCAAVLQQTAIGLQCRRTTARRSSDSVATALLQTELCMRGHRRNSDFSIQIPLLDRESMYQARRRSSSDSIQCALQQANLMRTGGRRSSETNKRHGGGGGRRRSAGSFADYSSSQLDLSPLGLQALQEYLLEDLSEDGDEESSFGSLTDSDSYISLEDLVHDDDDTLEQISVTDLMQMDPTPCHEPCISGTTPLVSAFAKCNGDKKAKKLSFGTVTTREYAVTVGALSASNDKCPLQLTWEHGCDVRLDLPPIVEALPPCTTPTKPRSLPLKRLTVDERRRRIANVQGIPEDQVDQMQFDMVMNQIQEAMNGLLSPRCLDFEQRH
jgi:hypothetical protein